MLLVAIVVIIGFVIALWVVRKAFRAWWAEDDAVPTGFTLGSLRELRRTGRITDEEFERTKAMILSATKPSPPTQAFPVVTAEPGAETADDPPRRPPRERPPGTSG